jgi:rubrerythrin
MAFFEDFGKKLSDLGQTAVEKTKNSTESIRLHNMIREEQKHSKDVYQQIGSLYVKLYGDQPEEAFAKMVQEIEESEARIRNYEGQLQQLKETTPPTEAASATTDEAPTAVCPNCGKTIHAEDSFCNGCGQKLS